MAQTIVDDRDGGHLAPSPKPHCGRQTLSENLARKIDSHYGALFSSVRQLQFSGKIHDEIWLYQSPSAACKESIFLFEFRGSEIKVLNEQIGTAASDVERFVEYLFMHYPVVTRIAFFGVAMGRLATNRPYQRFFCAEDIVISGYHSDVAYEKSIGKNTRRNIRRNSAALAGRYPGCRFEVLDAEAIGPEPVARVIAFNRSSMARKNRTSTYGSDDVERLVFLAARDGLVGALRLDGEMVAGTVCARVGDCFYMLATGHDFRFDEFSPGLLCCYWTARECFRRGAREINLMGGRLDYKYWLRGRSRKYDALRIYRSRAAMLRNAGSVIDTALRGACLETKFALLDCERKDSVAAQLIARGIRAWRSAKALRRQDIP